ncbi:bifunctional molybdopterin-guanine dinucleotide biosynthesis adaptor protein MobB/molybdopterin molybdotransferase MoeA [Pseudoruegeria sp. SHC-113]|uniref:bifunctional molybdopterin-guanine dinucleotide biosynthesis adaptor protein MobB/molybdopterin molybdotransferase MoeA n=1 Tax=Pseudoruegeria sp. SHC-113 TaxID=2855439 RepID=UPI0021BB2396|nr:bifunctional molybdopterin-guanine dinucleotide biosynthesis adaptor protein MobB/molybdopterin molybdotransferase MoeA [Pseudoruegeria sp. SHC-113]MCT8158932.1 bifunctional molybdopterin-guanine dinucleotide biosynthesis adaptor protein MobB/molybdopterin molybdotransferase MoeA [Pseudoruegeria sp. SHC-113]
MRVYGIVGYKNAGKTGLVERLVAEITARGFTVSTLKHAHHGVDVDQPGRDSHRHREAGAQEVLLASAKRWALMHELRGAAEPAMAEQLARLSPVDLVLVEGFKREDHPKVEAFRQVANNPLIAAQDASVRAVAADCDVEAGERPVFDLDDTGAIADFILAEVGLVKAPAPAAPLTPPKLKDDCFALPPGVSWTPVEEALARLRAGLSCVVAQERLPLDQAAGRILAQDAIAARANPPAANCAVDGYGMRMSDVGGAGPFTLPLAEGRAAAGAPYAGTPPAGHALRILTGALVPPGMEAVVMDEDVALGEGQIAFEGPIKPGANLRKAGEDVAQSAIALPAGTLMGAPEIALLAAVGVAEVAAYRPLRVGVLSTGDELAPSGSTMDRARTFDANRPMLLELARRWGYVPVDLGHVRDERSALRERLNSAAREADVILTSGGASAGDEDHVSALLREEGALQSWRIALKPGRPLALALWDGVPVFGLPGNPVAAFVCSLIFARPAFSVLAGGAWLEPMGFTVPAAFSKRKKAGRREYLRARLNAQGEAEVFASEGSGRISGLAWAEGIVELEDGAREIAPGDPVRFVPYGSFGLG